MKNIIFKGQYSVCEIVTESYSSSLNSSAPALSFRCTNGDFYVALGSSMGLALSVRVGRWSVKAGFIHFSDNLRSCTQLKTIRDQMASRY